MRSIGTNGASLGSRVGRKHQLGEWLRLALSCSGDAPLGLDPAHEEAAKHFAAFTIGEDHGRQEGLS